MWWTVLVRRGSRLDELIFKISETPALRCARISLYTNAAAISHLRGNISAKAELSRQALTIIGDWRRRKCDADQLLVSYARAVLSLADALGSQAAGLQDNALSSAPACSKR